ncbi:MAG: TonB-dependent receptor [Saprospirales bacterium]|nr:MAG: TonB-dependent receptor [Saprospirales bacterium]
MLKFFIPFLLFLLPQVHLAGEVRGLITDLESNEPLIGVVVKVVENDRFAVSGLDGTYIIRNLQAGDYNLEFSYLGYATETILVSVGGGEVAEFNVTMSTEGQTIGEVVVTSRAIQNTEYSARLSERNALNVINVVSSQNIELSPDITVANVMQRVSGVSLERNHTGDGQHAIIRGMDKRYNYSLVNGVKIPSPERNNRYVPLDIFPADLLDRLEVTKSLTPDMEADAIGGAVDMKLKDAPEELMLNFNLGVGINTMFFERDFMTFDKSRVNDKSPLMIHGDGYRATQDDFPLEVANHIVEDRVPVNRIMGGSFGSRFGSNNQFGVIAAVSHQHTYRGSESTFFHLRTDRETNLPGIDNVLSADRSTRQKRTGAHVKVDYRINSENYLSFYSSYMNLAEEETRVMVDTALTLGRSGIGTGRIEQWIRTRQRISNIHANALQGNHKLTRNLELDWSAVYSTATYDDPDMAEFMTISERRKSSDGGFTQSDWVFDNTNHRGFFRRWMGNSDTDIAAYLNLKYKLDILGLPAEIKVGGMYRNKERENYFDRYRLGTSPAFQVYEGDITQNTFNVAINGSPNNVLNYELTENVMAGYGMLTFRPFSSLQVVTGLRMERTDLSWISKAPPTVQGGVGEKIYTELLPHLHLKYELDSRQNLRLSYFESLSRQGYFEIIPYNFYEEDQFRESGNPNLLHAYARNLDMRYEFFPSRLDQFMVGLFWKSIDNPIETAVIRREDLANRLFLTPQNFGTATNMGVEVDVIRYFNRFGIRANYTFTNSEISSSKIVQFRNEEGALDSRIEEQVRPLQGQSAHLGNFSLLYKNQESGTDLQLSLVYTGRRIAYISAFKDNDQWQRAFTALDFSFDQRITPSITAYAKVMNILNTPFELEIVQSNEVAAASEPHLQPDADRILSRSDLFHRTILLGLRFTLNNN